MEVGKLERVNTNQVFLFNGLSAGSNNFISQYKTVLMILLTIYDLIKVFVLSSLEMLSVFIFFIFLLLLTGVIPLLQYGWFI